MCGRISVESEVGRGTTFVVDLPRTPQGAPCDVAQEHEASEGERAPASPPAA